MHNTFGKNVNTNHKNVNTFDKNVDVFANSLDVFGKNIDVSGNSLDVSGNSFDVFHKNVNTFVKNVNVFAVCVFVFVAPPAFAAKDDVQIGTALVASGSSNAETNAGDFVADAVREKANADIALVPAADFSDVTINAGSASADKVLGILSNAGDNSNTIVVLKLTGTQVLKALERSVSRTPGSFSGFLQVSGLQIRYSDSAPSGKRIILAGTGGSDVDTHKTYRVAVTKPLALGNLGYFEVWKSGDIVQETGATLAKAVAEYCASHKNINVTTEGRIVSAK